VSRNACCCFRRFDGAIEPMTLGNMRELDVRSLFVSCWNCHHQAVLSADHWPGDVAVPPFGPRMVCTECGIVVAAVRPNCKQQPPRETLTGPVAKLGAKGGPRPLGEGWGVGVPSSF
jgi:hypothetical protein